MAVDLRAVADTDVDPLLDAGVELIRFATELVTGGDAALDAARQQLERAAGPAAVVRAAAVAGNFQMMNRLVDATGVPVGASMWEIAAELGIVRPAE